MHSECFQDFHRRCSDNSESSPIGKEAYIMQKAKYLL